MSKKWDIKCFRQNKILHGLTLCVSGCIISLLTRTYVHKLHARRKKILERCLNKILVQTILIARKDFDYSYGCHNRAIASITSLQSNCRMNNAMEVYEKLDKLVQSRNNLKLLEGVIDNALIMLTPLQRAVVFMRFFRGYDRSYILKSLNICNWKFDYLLNQSYDAIAARLMAEGISVECFEEMFLDNPIFSRAFDVCIERSETNKKNAQGGGYGKKEDVIARCEQRSDKRVVVAKGGRLYYQGGC